MNAKSFAVSKIWTELSGAQNNLSVDYNREFGIVSLRSAESLVDTYQSFGYITKDEVAMFKFRIDELKRQYNVTAFS
jgi:hypothetical protein